MDHPDTRWATIMVFEPEHYHAHILPVSDLKDHEPFPDCWCEPVMDEYDPDIWTHNAADGREDREMERMKP